jgi:hypothetical protein
VYTFFVSTPRPKRFHAFASRFASPPALRGAPRRGSTPAAAPPSGAVSPFPPAPAPSETSHEMRRDVSCVDRLECELRRGQTSTIPKVSTCSVETHDQEVDCGLCGVRGRVVFSSRRAASYQNVVFTVNFTDHMAVRRCAYLHIFTGHSLFTIHRTARGERREVASHTPTPSTAGSKPRVWFTCCCIVSLLPGATSSTCCRRCGRRIRSISPLRCTNAGGVRPDVGR